MLLKLLLIDEVLLLILLMLVFILAAFTLIDEVFVDMLVEIRLLFVLML